MTEAQKARLLILEVVESMLDGGDITINAAKLLMVEKILQKYLTKEEKEAKDMNEYYTQMAWQQEFDTFMGNPLDTDFWLDKKQLAQDIN